jgi:hypothetical protein
MGTTTYREANMITKTKPKLRFIGTLKGRDTADRADFVRRAKEAGYKPPRTAWDRGLGVRVRPAPLEYDERIWLGRWVTFRVPFYDTAIVGQVWALCPEPGAVWIVATFDGVNRVASVRTADLIVAGDPADDNRLF